MHPKKEHEKRLQKAFGIEIEPDPRDKIIMTEKEQLQHKLLMDELNAEWKENSELHKERRYESRGIRSSQISALIAFLVKKGILKYKEID